MIDIRERLERHISQLAPHIKSRETGKLLADALAEIDRERRRVAWYSQRFDALQAAQKNMRDPERGMVCDILANGMTYLTGEHMAAEIEGH